MTSTRHETPTPHLAHDSEAEVALRAAMDKHHAIAARLPPVWLGAEPTFTDRYSEAPEWLSQALGDDKRERAERLIRLLAKANPGAAVLRPLGRQYDQEPEPRWCYGLYLRRDGLPCWDGPTDRLRDQGRKPTPRVEAQHFCDSLVGALKAAGYSAAALPNTDTASPRLVFRRDQERPLPLSDSRLSRPTIHLGPMEGPVEDDLAQEGSFLVLVHPGSLASDANRLWLELPGFSEVGVLLEFLSLVSRTSKDCALDSLGLRGYQPPLDQTVAWTTLTPDPAVLEVNQAPEPTVQAFHEQNKKLFALTSEVGLSPYRLQYNGAVGDSGGGGQLTFGGPSAAHSPFFAQPELLPRLIRYLIRHPSLSYWFATQYVGGSSQSPRPDEGVRESFQELEVALDQLAVHRDVAPALLWSTLHHFLADSSGNPHRSELNIEKLHNEHLPGRGCLGLVEFRALGMSASPEQSTARALLLHSLISMLQQRDAAPELVHWRDELHDRFALPWYLRRDLREVFTDLRSTGLPLDDQLQALLLTRRNALLGEFAFGGVHVQLEQALEFWPIVGDTAQQRGDSRLVDSSTSRIQILLTAAAAAESELDRVEVSVKGHRIPLRKEHHEAGVARVLGLRFRSFVPWRGLHPTLPAETSLNLTFCNDAGKGLTATLHQWRPDGSAYQGLPKDLTEAQERRFERVVSAPLGSQRKAPLDAPARATTPYCLDLRRLTGPA